MITYGAETGAIYDKAVRIISVYFDGVRAGHIRQTVNGFDYTPKGSKERRGPFETLATCKAAI